MSRFIVAIVLLVTLFAGSTFAAEPQSNQLPCGYDTEIFYGDFERLVARFDVSPGCIVGTFAQVTVYASSDFGPIDLRIVLGDQTTDWLPSGSSVTFNLPPVGDTIPLNIYARNPNKDISQRPILGETLRQDLTPPDTTFVNPPSTIEDELKLQWTSTDVGVGFVTYEVEGRVGASGVWTPLPYSEMRQGGEAIGGELTYRTFEPHGTQLFFRVRATDELGNVGSWAEVVVTVDKPTPQTAFTTFPAFIAYKTDLAWGTTNDARTVSYDIQRRDGGGSWVNVLTQTTTTSLRYHNQTAPHGTQVFFRIRGRDAFGNVEPWPDDYDAVMIVDQVGPTGVLDVSFVGVGSVEVLPAATDDLSGVGTMRVALEGDLVDAPWVEYRSPVGVSILDAPDGCIVVAAQFRDAVNNTGKVVRAPVPGTGCDVEPTTATVYLPMVRR